MNVISAIEQRRSVKRFDPHHVMTREEEEQLLRLTMLSPTAFNLQHWRFVVVREKSLRQQIRAVAWNQAQVTDASLLVIFCADLLAWEKNPERYWETAAQETRQMIVSAIGRYYADQEQVQRDEALRSCGIAAQTLMLAAQGLGYDSCPMTGFDFEAVARFIHLPPDHVITMMVAVGKALEPARPRGGQLPLDAVRILDRF
ncbi:MAG: nitroreductase family protein [Magnetococcales bacterium]|nr:nitroreductase family protein [Magnetococcales bacterium]NGZ04963.1 nitroreductase family protein [Magnetococcales bacterium]